MISYALDNYIFSDRKFHQLSKILDETGLSKKQFLEVFDTINKNLLAARQRPFELNQGVLAIPEYSADFEAVRFGISRPSQLTLHEEERQALIYLLSFSTSQNLSVQDFQDFLVVSRNTVLSDIKRLRESLEACSIGLIYDRKSGFYLLGDEKMLRRFAFSRLNKLSDTNGFYVLSRFINQSDPESLGRTYQRLKKLSSALAIQSIYSRFLLELFYTHLLFLRLPKHTLITSPSVLYDDEAINQLCAPFFGEAYNQAEKDDFLALLFGMSSGEAYSKNLDFLYRVGFQLMENVLKLTAIEFEDFTKTFTILLNHLIPTYFRLTYHFELENRLLDRIKREYAPLFELIKEALKPLEEVTGGEISEDELAYFVIIFGSELHNQRHHLSPRAVVVCADGVSSSLLARKRLEVLFPSIDFILTANAEQLEEIPPDSYEIIFSTLPIDSKAKVYPISPLSDWKDERLLYNQVLHDFSLPGLALPSAQSLVASIEPYLKEKVDKEKLTYLIERKLSTPANEKQNGEQMLSDLLTKENIAFTNGALHWENAIELAAHPLLINGSIEEAYVAAIIHRLKEFGPFMDLGKGICLAHARPEEGVNRVGMTLLKCEKAVALLDDPKHLIKIFIVLAATDNESHLLALSTLMQILTNEEELNNLLAATSVTDVENILQKEERLNE